MSTKNDDHKPSPSLKQTKLNAIFAKTPTPKKSDFTIKPVLTETLTKFLIDTMHSDATDTRLVCLAYEKIRTNVGRDMVGKNGVPASVEEFVDYMHDNTTTNENLRRYWNLTWGQLHRNIPIENRDHSAKTSLATAAHNKTGERLKKKPRSEWFKRPVKKTSPHQPAEKTIPSKQTPPSTPEGQSPWTIDRMPREQETQLGTTETKTSTGKENPKQPIDDTTSSKNKHTPPPDPNPQEEHENYNECPDESMNPNDETCSMYDDEAESDYRSEDSYSTGFPLL